MCEQNTVNYRNEEYRDSDSQGGGPLGWQTAELAISVYRIKKPDSDLTMPIFSQVMSLPFLDNRLQHFSAELL